MKTYKQLLNHYFTTVVCRMLLSILTAVSVHAVAAVAPTDAQKLEFENYLLPIYQDTAQLPGTGGWERFHRNNSYVRTEIVGYTVPKKYVADGGLFVAHGIITDRSSPQAVRQRMIYRFNGDGSYWVVVRPGGRSMNPRIVSPTEYVSGYVPRAGGFIVETVGQNAIRKWATVTVGGQLTWATRSKPSPQEALDAYNDRVFLNPPMGGPLDIEAGDPSLETITGIGVDELKLKDVDVEIALRRTMNLNKLLQLQSDPNLHPTYTRILAKLRKQVFKMEPAEVTLWYGLFRDSLPRGGDYDFPPGCADD